MKNTNWYRIFAGDVVKFRYKSEDGLSADRTVICLDPRYRYRKKSTGRIVEYFIGLQIDTTGPAGVLQQGQLKQLIELLGESEQDLSRVVVSDTARMKKIYAKLKSFLSKNDIFRTYFFRECRRRRVFLLDKYSNLNKYGIEQIGKQLLKESRTQAQLEVSKEGL